MTGVARHIWLLLTLRHGLAGLPRQSFILVCATFLASSVIASWRCGDPLFVPAHLVVLCLVARIVSVQAASAYALLSIGIDVIAVPVEAMSGSRGGFIPFGAWEMAGWCAILWRDLSRCAGNSDRL